MATPPPFMEIVPIILVKLKRRLAGEKSIENVWKRDREDFRLLDL